MIREAEGLTAAEETAESRTCTCCANQFADNHHSTCETCRVSSIFMMCPNNKHVLTMHIFIIQEHRRIRYESRERNEEEERDTERPPPHLQHIDRNCTGCDH